MVTVMNKIVRLSWANIKKHKLEAVALMILVMLCMMLMGSALASFGGIKEIFPYTMKSTESFQNYLLMTENAYDEEYEDIIREDERVEELVRSQAVYSMSTNYLDRSGKEQALYMCFITMDNNNKLQKTNIETSLSDEEIAALEHPVYMPYAVQDTMGYKEGDKFDMVFGTRKFSFTVAGFYDTLLFDSAGGGFKMIISDSDYHILETVLTKYEIIGYNDCKGEGGTELLMDLINKCTERSHKDVSSGIIALTYNSIDEGITYGIKLMLKFLVIMAAVIIISVAVMIRFRIVGDIKEHIVSIGVLEALGYRSREITLSYVIEYLIISLAGIAVGTGGCMLITPVLLHIGEIIAGHHGSGSVALVPMALTALAILAFVAFIAFIKANMVRKYPPVRALRKGIGDNHFKKERLPLRNTRKSVHLRLAMKGFLQNFKQNLGLTLCITISSLSIVVSFIMFSFFSKDMNAISASAGMELSNLRIELMSSVNAEEFAEELMEMPEVRKAVPTSSMNFLVTASDFNEKMFPLAFSDYSVTENIFPFEGRFPEHDNEVMISSMFSKVYKLKTGDSMTLEYLNVKRKYIVSGVVTSVTNGGVNLYITDDGLRRIIPTYSPDTIELYLNDGVETNDFRYVLTEKYGRSIADASQGSIQNGTYEEKIKAAAEKKIAELMANSGASHIEYAIRSGDTVIKGNSDGFIIRSIMNIGDILKTQLGGLALAIAILTSLFMGISALVVMIILFILMESSVRKQRREFGIMKGMGYTSRELMLQLAFRIMPASVFSVAIGTVVGVSFIKLLTSFLGRISVNIPAVIVLDIILLMFCFACAYIGARKIKKISVCELMAE